MTNDQIKARHLIFEGIDRVGKSTLIFGLQQRLGIAQVQKMRVPKNLSDSIFFYREHFEQLICANDCELWDRGHISELVYAPLYRPATAPLWWRESLRYWPQSVSCPVAVVYLYPGSLSLLLDDEDRPGANRLLELEGYGEVLRKSQMTWPLIDICAHHFVEGKGRQWRSVDSMLDELQARVQVQY